VDSKGTPAAVIGFLFRASNDTGAHNFALDQLLPRGLNVTDAVGEMNLGGFLDSVDVSEFYNYDGSFTTPPCTEGINWFVVKDVQTISQAQLNSFTRLWAGNVTHAGGKGTNRVVQPLGSRTLRRTDKGDSSVMATFLRENFNSGFSADKDGPTVIQVTLAAVLTPVLVITAAVILFFAWKNYHLKKQLEQKSPSVELHSGRTAKSSNE
jgi:hypothetical protein